MNFTGTLNGKTYDDAALFAVDVKAAKQGWPRDKKQTIVSGKLDRGNDKMPALTAAEKEWLGMFVTHPFGGTGQVWCIGGPGIVAVVFGGTREATWQKASELTKVASIRLRAEQDAIEV